MPTQKISVRVPQLVDIESAIRIYYNRVELSTSDIYELFDCCKSTASKLKKAARQKMAEDGTPSWNAQNVNTEAAFLSWGLNIADLEARLVKLRRLKLLHEAE